MKVAVLQQFLRSLAAPLQAAGANPKSTADLEQTVQALEPFKEQDFGQLAAHLVQVEEFDRTKLLPMLKNKARPRGGEKTLNDAQVQHLVREIRALEERATAAGPGRAELAPEVERLGLDNLTKPEAVAVAQAVGVPTKARTTAADAVDLIRQLVLEGREALDRRPARNAPELDAAKIQHVAQQVRHLEERAAGADASPEGLNADLDRLGLDALSRPELFAVAKELGVRMEFQTSAAEAAQRIRRSVLDRKEALETAKVEA